MFIILNLKELFFIFFVAIKEMGDVEQIASSTINIIDTGKESNSQDNVPHHVLAIKKWLNKSMKVKITDGRVLVGVFLCTDKHSNIILGSCLEYIDSSGIILSNNLYENNNDF